MRIEEKGKIKMKIKQRVVCAVLALMFVFTSASCMHSVPEKESQTTEPVAATREYVYKGLRVDVSESVDNLESESEPQTQKSEEKSSIKKIVEMLPQIIRPKKKKEEAKETVRINIPAGLTMTEIFSVIEDSGISTFSQLMNAAQNFNFTYYPLIKAQKNTGRAHVLEGYLCSGEYVFEKNSKPDDIIGAMLRRTESKVTSQYRRQIAKQGKTIDDVIIIASIIQKECINVKEMKKLSAVINNRLSDGTKLEMQSTAIYIENNIKPYIAQGDIDSAKKYNEYYNTLICSALPAGPICTPSAYALDAALNPEGDYRYFCVDDYGNYFYSVTAQEHEQAVAMLEHID